MSRILSILVLCVASSAFAQDAPPEMGGPVLDKIIERIEKRINEQQDASKAEREVLNGRITDMLGQVRASVAELRNERETARADRAKFMDQVKADRKEFMGRFTDGLSNLSEWKPGQEIVKRLTALVWWLIALVASIAVLAGMVGFMYLKIKKQITGA